MTDRSSLTRFDPPHNPHLDDVEISMYLEGDADEDTLLHMEQCAGCRARAEHFATQQDHLRGLLHRSTCPQPDQLRDYAWDLLADDELEKSIQHHLGFCPYCTHDYFHDYYAGDTSGEDLFTVAAAGGRPPFRQAVRIETMAHSGHQRDGNRPKSKVALFQGDANSMLMITELPDDGDTDSFVLEGNVSGIETDGLQVNVWLAERLIATCLLDPAGDFRVVGLQPGNYEIILNGSTFKLRVQHLAVGNTPPDEYVQSQNHP